MVFLVSFSLFFLLVKIVSVDHLHSFWLSQLNKCNWLKFWQSYINLVNCFRFVIQLLVTLYD